MKVRCIDNDHGRYHLTIGKVYDVIQQVVDTYTIANDDGETNDYFMTRFEIVQDAIKRVRCVAPLTGHLTTGKVYEVVNVLSQDYEVRDDTGNTDLYIKSRFVPVYDDAVVEPATKEAPTLPAPPQDPPFDFDAYNGIKPLRKVHIP